MKITRQRVDPSFVKQSILALLIAFCSHPASSAETSTFVDPAGGYTYEYPANFVYSTLFADGTGGRDSVSNSSMERGDINFRFVITDDNDKQPDLTGANLDAFVEEFKAAFAPTRKSRFIGVANTTLIGTLAADMGFERRHVFNNTWFQKARVIATRTAGRYYSLQCAYPIASAAEYNPVCESIAASVRLTK